MAHNNQSNCYSYDRIIEPQFHKNFLQENKCQICQKLAEQIFVCQSCCTTYGLQCLQNSKIEKCLRCQSCLFYHENPIFTKMASDCNIMDSISNPNQLSGLKTARFLKNMYKNESQLKIRCVNFQNGCEEQLDYDCEHVNAHEVQCQYRKMACPQRYIGCTWRGTKREYTQVHTQCCDFIRKECQFCKEMKIQGNLKFNRQELLVHYNSCPNKKIISLHNELQQKQNHVLNNFTQNQKEIEVYRQMFEALSQQKEKIIKMNEQKNQQFQFYHNLQKQTHSQLSTSSFSNIDSEELNHDPQNYYFNQQHQQQQQQAEFNNLSQLERMQADVEQIEVALKKDEEHGQPLLDYTQDQMFSSNSSCRSTLKSYDLSNKFDNTQIQRMVQLNRSSQFHFLSFLSCNNISNNNNNNASENELKQNSNTDDQQIEME